MWIAIEGLELVLHLGAYEQERAQPQRCSVDVLLALSATRGAHTDAVSDTVEYDGVAVAIRHATAERSFALVEHLAQVVLHAVTKISGVRAAQVAVRKPGVPKGAHAATVIVQSPAWDGMDGICKIR